tara:strand:+ start:942 stop:1088 length:147 start_codon:yes stop_codon:yes gene_type:complete
MFEPAPKINIGIFWGINFNKLQIELTWLICEKINAFPPDPNQVFFPTS